jgi:ketosteroid isomerase-like protein
MSLCAPKGRRGTAAAVFGMVDDRSNTGTLPAGPDVGQQSGRMSQTTQNKSMVAAYMDAFRTTDRPAILACLTEDVEWLIPGAFHIRGKDEFAAHIVDEGFTGRPLITVDRLVEEHDVVVAEGAVIAPRTDGTVVKLVFCDVFEMRGGRIRKLVSYLMPVR